MKKCGACEKEMQDDEMSKERDVPGFTHHADMARLERSNRRLWVLVIILVAALFGQFVLHEYSWMSYDYCSESTQVSQDGNGLNIYGDRNGVMFDGADGDEPEADETEKGR